MNLIPLIQGPYDLHMICGKNVILLPPESYYHINFFASPVGDNNVPTLFFAEVRGTHKDVKDVTLCCPVTETNGMLSFVSSSPVSLCASHHL